MNKKKVSAGEMRIIPLDNRLLEMPPYVNEHMTLPRWFKGVDKDAPGSIRGCAGVTEYLTTGITVPAWTNMHFRPNHENRKWESRLDDFSPQAGINRVDNFPYEATGACPMTNTRKLDEGYQYPKIVTPYKFQTAKGWSTLVIPHNWEPNNDYSVMSAIVHTDYYHSINCVLNITANSDFKILYGTPLFHLVPFKRSGDFEKIIFEDESEFKYYAGGGFGFGHIIPTGMGSSGPYRRARRKIDAEVDAEESISRIAKLIKKIIKSS